MSILIKGMEMPEGCGECNIPCGINDVDRVLFGFDKTRPKNCPLIEIPEPHGRLVDADKLIMHLADYQLQESPGWGSNGYGNADRYEAITDCIDAVESAYTVIETEGE